MYCQLTIKLIISKLLSVDDSHSWTEPRFPTECFFFTVHCQHLAILPAIRHYRRRSTDARELQRVTEELTATESIWSNLPIAARNRQMLNKSKLYLQVIVRELFLIIL